VNDALDKLFFNHPGDEIIVKSAVFDNFHHLSGDFGLFMLNFIENLDQMHVELTELTFPLISFFLGLSFLLI